MAVLQAFFITGEIFMERGLTNGDYLRILERTLADFDIGWFDIGIKATENRGLFKEENCWIIKDYLGTGKNVEKTIVLSDASDYNMEDICRRVIDHVADDVNEEYRLKEYFNKQVDVKKCEIANTTILPRIKKESREKGIQIPEIYYHEMLEDLMGFLSGYHSLEDVSDIYSRIKPCPCGGKVELHGIAGMGELDYIIQCKECTETLSRGLADPGNHYSDEDAMLNALIEDWNKGVRDKITEV